MLMVDELILMILACALNEMMQPLLNALDSACHI